MDGIRRGFDELHLDHLAPSVEYEHEVLHPILRHEFADTLILIINELDYVSFVRLSKTCRYLKDFCWNTKGIKVPFSCRVDVIDSGFQVWTGNISPYYFLDDRSRRNYTTAQVDDIIGRRVFSFNVELIRMDWLSEASIVTTNGFLTKLGCETSHRLRISNAVGVSSNSMIPFIKKLGVKEFNGDCALPDDVVTYLLKNVTSFCYGNRVPDRFYREVSVPRCLHLLGGNAVSLNDQLEILKGWARGDIDIDVWNIITNNVRPLRHRCVISDLLGHFQSTHISNLFNVPLPTARPLLLLGWHDSTYLLRYDGEILELGLVRLPGSGNISLRRPKTAILRLNLPKMFPRTDGRIFEFPGANYSYGCHRRWRRTLLR